MNNKIPRVIHYCWFGNGKKSELIEKCINSWKNKCPDYEIIEWNESNFDVNINTYCKEAYENKKWAFVSDYARLWILYNYGGIYLDTDVELIKNIDDLLRYDSFFASENDKHIATGLGCGAKKHNAIIKQILDDYNDIHFISNGNFDLTPCPKRNTESILKLLKNDFNLNDIILYENNIFLPKEYFCPLDYESKKLNITDNTYAIHWYNESWLSTGKKIRKKILVVLRNIIGKKNYEKLKRKIQR